MGFLCLFFFYENRSQPDLSGCKTCWIVRQPWSPILQNHHMWWKSELKSGWYFIFVSMTTEKYWTWITSKFFNKSMFLRTWAWKRNVYSQGKDVSFCDQGSFIVLTNLSYLVWERSAINFYAGLIWYFYCHCPFSLIIRLFLVMSAGFLVFFFLRFPPRIIVFFFSLTQVRVKHVCGIQGCLWYKFMRFETSLFDTAVSRFTQRWPLLAETQTAR